MVFFKRRTKRDYATTSVRTRLYLQIAAFSLLVFFALFGLIGRANSLRRLEKTREALASSLQDNMNQVLLQYNSMSRKSNTDIVDEVLPGMQQHMYTALTLNHLLTDSFGEKYSVISTDLYASFEDIVAEYAKQIAMGQSTSAAAEQMALCMNDIEVTLDECFGSDGLIPPRTARVR